MFFCINLFAAPKVNTVKDSADTTTSHAANVLPARPTVTHVDPATMHALHNTSSFVPPDKTKEDRVHTPIAQVAIQHTSAPVHISDVPLAISNTVHVITGESTQQQILIHIVNLKARLKELQDPIKKAIESQNTTAAQSAEALSVILKEQQDANAKLIEKTEEVAYATNALMHILSKIQPIATHEEQNQYDMEWKYKFAAVIFAIIASSTAIIRIIYELIYRKPLS